MDNNPNPANEPVTFPPNPKQAPTKPGLPENEGDKKSDRLNQVANRMAGKGAKTVQNFDKQKGNLISK
jgi:hypothetical protein